MKNGEYRRNRHSCYLLEYHLVVVTKYRHPVITGTLKDRLLELSGFILEECWGMPDLHGQYRPGSHPHPV